MDSVPALVGKSIPSDTVPRKRAFFPGVRVLMLFSLGALTTRFEGKRYCFFFFKSLPVFIFISLRVVTSEHVCFPLAHTIRSLSPLIRTASCGGTTSSAKVFGVQVRL